MRPGPSLALAVALALAAGAPSRAAAPAAPSGVVAAFLALPARYVDLSPAERRRRLTPAAGRLIARDDRNGYLSVSGDGGGPGFTVTVFRAPGAEPVVAVQRFDELHTRTWFLQRRGGAWTDVSAAVVPGYAPGRRYILPHVGVTLIADGAPMSWKGGRFTPAAAGPSAAPLPFVGRWKVTAVRVAPAKVQALAPDDPAYMGAVLDASPARLAWTVKPKGGTLGDVCQGPKLAAGVVTCASGSFGPPDAHVAAKPGELDLDWYDGARLELHRAG